MLILSTLALVAQAAAAAPTAPASAPPTTSELRGEALMQALQSGGYTILVRHARTDRSAPNAETPGSIPPLRMQQRNLSADGEHDVRLMAEVMRRFAPPIGAVVTSPLYRCRETADAFGPATVAMALRTFPTTAETRALVTAMPAAGTNRVLVTHHFVIEEHVPGIPLGYIGESEAAVVRPDGRGGVELVGRITLEDWRSLAGGARLADTGTTAAAASVAYIPVPTPDSTAQRTSAPPDTRAGRLVAHYIEVFNTGSGAAMEAFIGAALAPVAGRSTQDRVQSYLALFAEHGTLTVTHFEAAGGDAVTAHVQSRRGAIALTLTAAPAGERVQSITFALPGGHR